MASPSATGALTDLLGDTRARILREVQAGGTTAPELADVLGISAAAVRRHLGAMQADGLVESATVHDGGTGRPADRWTLTRRGKRLFADRSAEFADQLLTHLEARFGRAAVAEFLKDRNASQADRYAEDLAAVADPAERARLLAEALSDDGFAARVETGDNGRSLKLLQSHCAIEDIAKEHPEICAHEAALFKRVLGSGEHAVKVSRRDTIAAGSSACVCHIELPDQTTTTQTPNPDRSA